MKMKMTSRGRFIVGFGVVAALFLWCFIQALCHRTHPLLLLPIQRLKTSWSFPPTCVAPGVAPLPPPFPPSPRGQAAREIDFFYRPLTCSIFVFNLDFRPYLQMTDLQINYLANYAEALANGAAQLIAFYVNTFTPTEEWYIDLVYKCIISFILLWIVKRFHKIHSVGLIVKWFALQIIVFFTWVSSFHELTGQIHPLNVFVLLCLLAWIFTTVEDPSVSKPPTTHDEQPEVESGQWDYANANANLSVGVKKNKKRRGRRSKSKIRQKIQVVQPLQETEHDTEEETEPSFVDSSPPVLLHTFKWDRQWSNDQCAYFYGKSHTHQSIVLCSHTN